MAENKEQTLANLYSLRAGISAVANERNKVEEINRQKYKGVADLKDEIREMQNNEKDLVKQTEQVNDKIKESHNYINKNRNHKFPSKTKRNIEIVKSIFLPCGICFCLFIISVVYIVLYFLLIFPTLPYNRKESILSVLAFVGIGCVAIFFFFKYLLSAVHGVIWKIEEYKRGIISYHDIERELVNRSNLIKELQATAENNNRKISNNKELIANKQREIEQLKTSSEQACVPHFQLGGMIQEQFENEFNSFLNLRDWKNVDIIIFAYESGRVETMKEALTYADEETRTDRIVKAINDSTQAVCRSIQSGLHSLALSMGQCFSVISRQIAEQTRKLDKISVNIENLSANTARLAENTASYSSNLAKLATKVDYSNALQEQRNKSSAELVEKNEVFMLEARTYMHDLYNDRY